MDLEKLTLRLVLGTLMAGHGLQKLRGSFGGPGLDAASGLMEARGMRPGRANALAASWIETAGGVALAAGAATPAATAGLIATQIVAVRKVHLKNGVWNSQHGFEYNAVILAVLAALAEGAGRFSVDALLGRSRWGLGGAAVALVGGIAGSIAAIEAGRRYTDPAGGSGPEK